MRLTHCSVNLSTRKEFCFAINGRLSSQFFYAKTESDMQQWIDAIKSCIKDEEAHETRQLVRRLSVASNITEHSIGQGRDQGKRMDRRGR